METEMELSTERPSLLILNDYCVLKIFEFLQLDDFINVAESCTRLRRIADRAVKIKSNFVLDGNMFRKGGKYIDRVFTHIGHNVPWLTIDCHAINPNLSKIVSDCNNLKSLKIRSWQEHDCQVDSTLHNFDKIELLSLWLCDLGKLKMFLKNFHKLKYLTIYYCWNKDEELMASLLNNNPEMESLCYINGSEPNKDFCIFKLLERIPKLKTLYLDIDRTLNTTELNSLITLNGLTKLRLHCRIPINIKNVLIELAKKGIMEEMQLDFVEVNDNLFDILKSFVRLQLLVIYSAYNVEVKSSAIWPTNLKWLRLHNIKLTHFSFISTIQQLKSLEYMSIHGCPIAKSDIADFKNVAKLSQNILNAMDCGNRKQQLEVVLSRYSFGGDLKTVLLVDSKPLRILRSYLSPRSFVQLLV